MLLSDNNVQIRYSSEVSESAEIRLYVMNVNG